MVLCVIIGGIVGVIGIIGGIVVLYGGIMWYWYYVVVLCGITRSHQSTLKVETSVTGPRQVHNRGQGYNTEKSIMMIQAPPGNLF